MISRPMIRLLVLIIFVALLSGCWDVKDINKRYLPVVMGINMNDDGLYKIILQVPNIKGGTLILEGESRSISKAMDTIRTKAEKSVDLIHLRLFLVSQKIAEKGMKDIVDYAMRASDISIKGMVAIVTGDFEKTLHHSIKPTPEVSSYDYFSEEAGWTPSVSINRIWEAYRGTYSYTEDFAIPLVERGTTTLFVFKGSAIMRRDRMVGILSPDETLLNNIFQEKYTGGTIELAEDASILIKKASVHNHTKWPATGPELVSRIRLDVEITENKKNKKDNEIAKDLKKLLEKQAKSITEKLRSLKADVLGNGQLFRHRMSNQQLKDWKDKLYPELKHEIIVEVNILDSIDFKEK
ncbi:MULTISPECIES: Ger(x)C family spore germination protein [unclassified Paenibacillus]|uniref:Ger(x)C family spore germination protein n=1 Tax=unclassified Paenibacillus TaxID=185978 RepID=UPI003641FD28